MKDTLASGDRREVDTIPEVNKSGSMSSVTMSSLDDIQEQPQNDQECAREKPESRQTDQEPDIVYPRGISLALIVFSLCLAIVLIALDRTIIATAIPTITDTFDSLGDAGWYGSAFLLTSCSLQLSFGRLYTCYPVKQVWLISIVVFEIGSAICGAAPSSIVFTVGRAVAGLGTAGVISGAYIIVVYAVPLQRRPIVTSSIGSLFGVAGIIAPLLGGAFTESVLTWRWCFYINLPVGAIAIGIITIILKNEHEPKDINLPTLKKLGKLDPFGMFTFVPAIVCLLLALQWGGSTYAWSSGRIVALLVIFAVLIILFVFSQERRQESATVPPRIIKNRSIYAGMIYSFFSGGSMMVFVYYIADWFQTIQGVTPVESGIHNLAMTLSYVFTSLLSGYLVSKIGYYTPFMIASGIVSSIGAGLLTTLNPSSGPGMWISYQIIYGFGLGMGMQKSNLAAQTVLSRRDVPIGSSLMIFAQTLGGSVFLSAGQSIISNHLVEGLSGINGIHLSAADIVSTGATELRDIVPENLLPLVLQVYNDAIMDCFKLGLACTCATVVGAVLMEMNSVKQKHDKTNMQTSKKEEMDGKVKKPDMK